MESIDVPVALLGYGTVGAAVNRLLTESAEDIERATGRCSTASQRQLSAPQVSTNASWATRSASVLSKIIAAAACRAITSARLAARRRSR